MENWSDIKVSAMGLVMFRWSFSLDIIRYMVCPSMCVGNVICCFRLKTSKCFFKLYCSLLIFRFSKDNKSIRFSLMTVLNGLFCLLVCISKFYIEILFLPPMKISFYTDILKIHKSHNVPNKRVPPQMRVSVHRGIPEVTVPHGNPQVMY